MPKTSPTFDDLKAEYERLWTSARIKTTWTAALDKRARAIHANKARYQSVSAETGVPWWLIGVIHSMECGLSFAKHLHNGDSLKARTYRVPAGRPLKGEPPYTWEESAADALAMKGLAKIADWSPARVCYELERYNGFGYRTYHPETLSPYLWSGTNHYSKGKYVADGKWSASAVSGQTGTIPLLLRLAVLDPSISFGREAEVEIREPAKPATPKDLTPLSAKLTVLHRVKVFIQSVAATIASLFTLDHFELAKGVLDDSLRLGKEFALPLTVIGLGVALWLVSWLIARIWSDYTAGRYTPSGASD